MELNDLKNLKPVEKVQAMEMLWEDINASSVAIESPDWHNDVLTKRSKSLEEGNAKFLSLAELKALKNT